MRCLVFALFVLFAMPAGAGIPGCDWPVVRDPADVAALIGDQRLDAGEAARLHALAAQRQGIAARLLELRYQVGKSAGGGDAQSGRIAELRHRVVESEEQLDFADDEIAGFLRATCLKGLENGAAAQDRTEDLILTKDALYH